MPRCTLQHETEVQQAAASGANAADSTKLTPESSECLLCGTHHHAEDTSPTWCFVTRDLVSWSGAGAPGTGCCSIEGRAGSIVKVLGAQVNLLTIEAAVQV